MQLSESTNSSPVIVRRCPPSSRRRSGYPGRVVAVVAQVAKASWASHSDIFAGHWSVALEATMYRVVAVEVIASFRNDPL